LEERLPLLSPPRDVTTVDRLGWRRRQSQSVVIIVWREVVRRMVVNQTDVGSLVTMQRRHDNIDVPKLFYASCEQRRGTDLLQSPDVAGLDQVT